MTFNHGMPTMREGRFEKSISICAQGTGIQIHACTLTN